MKKPSVYVGSSIFSPRPQVYGLVEAVDADDREDGAEEFLLVTLLDTAGHQVARATSREDGSYAVDTSERGSLVLIGSAPGYQP